MTKKMLIDAAHQEEVRVCVLKDGKVEDFDFESASRKPLRGNIYLARVTRVEPSLQAAFIEYGGNRHGFLAFNEIHPDYYQIPVSDRRAIQEAEAEEAALAAELDLAQRGDDHDSDDFDPSDGTQDELEDDAVDNEEESDDASAAFSSDEDASLSEAYDAPEASSDDAGDDRQEAELHELTDDAGQASDIDDEFAEDIAEDATLPEDTDQPDYQEGDIIEALPVDTADTAADAEKDFEASEKSSRRELLERYKEARRKRSRLVRSYKIQEVIKRRQILLVQVVKEERGNKGAALTTYMSLAGRYCVLMPNTARGGGISRKIPSHSDRKRLRRIVDDLDVSQGMGLIIRTAGAKRTKAEIKRDYEYLTRLWENIRTLTLKSIAPCLIYEEASLIKRAIRDLYDKDISSVLVSGDEGYREAKDFMKMLMPSHAKNVQPYKEKLPIFVRHDVETQLDAMFQPVVRLKSGGYLVINQTEALIAIDVNSGKATRERNIELTALKTNLEAAKEAARQFRLRDLAGLIVIDFIDMEENKNNRAVEKKLKDAVKNDRARIQIGRISNFGLMEMSRQRRRSGIIDGTTSTCPTCGGAGAVRSHETAALRILRTIESEAIAGRAGSIVVKAAADVALYILNHKRAWLTRIETDHGVSIDITADPDKAGDQYDLEKSGTPKPRSEVDNVIRADQPELETEAMEADASEADVEDDGSEKKRRKRRRKRKKSETRADDASPADREQRSDGDETEEADKKSASDLDDSTEEKPKRRRRRGRRGGRRNNRSVEKSSEAEDQASKQADSDEGGSDVENITTSSEEKASEPSEQPAIEEASSKTEETQNDPSGENGYENGARAEASNGSTQEPEENGPPQPELTSADDDEAAAAQSVPKKSKSSRKGWWQKALGG